jgi:hypothetical protein
LMIQKPSVTSGTLLERMCESSISGSSKDEFKMVKLKLVRT